MVSWEVNNIMCTMSNRRFLAWIILCLLGFMCIPLIFGGCTSQLKEDLTLLKDLTSHYEGKANVTTTIRAHLPTKASGGMETKFALGSEGYIDVKVIITGTINSRDNLSSDNISGKLP